MATCTPAEIAEKRRIALEKLKTRKINLKPDTTKPSVLNPNYNQGTRNKVLNNTPSNSNSQEPQVQSTKSFFSSPQSNRAPLPEAKGGTSANAFINALKQNSVIAIKKDTVPTVYPNQGTSSKRTTNFLSQEYKTLAGPSPKKVLAPVFNHHVYCKVYMISSTRFAVHSSNYNSKLIDVFKCIPSRNYDTNTRIWNFLIKDYNLVQTHVGALKPDVTIGVIPKSVLNLCLVPEKELNFACLNSIDENLNDKLLPFQREGVCFAIAQHGRAMICDEMGLGKTYQAIAIADFYRENWPLLICTTATTRSSWCNHIRELLPTLPVHTIQVLTNNQQYIGDAKVLIASYNMIEKNMNHLLEHRFGFLVFDESHMLKNNKAKCTIMAERLSKQAKHIILLSGTPALSRPVELFTQMHMIDPKFMNFIDYTTRYCDGKQTHFGWDATGQSNLEELNVILKLKYMIRRTKANVLPEMAEKFRETVILDSSLIWTSKQAKLNYETVTNNLLSSKGKEKEEMLLQFYSDTAEIKSRAVCAYLKSIAKDGIKFIVFAHHRVMMDAITESFTKMGMNFVRIDGSTRNDRREEFINKFQKDHKCQAAVLSLKSCNSGITLTAAEMIIFAELDWNPSTLVQAESRAHRIGQQKNLKCRYLMASKTADDIIWNMLKNKQEILNKAGIFCENLQEVTNTSTQSLSYKLDHYFSPIKSLSISEKLQKVDNNKNITPDIVETKKILAKEKELNGNLIIPPEYSAKRGRLDECKNVIPDILKANNNEVEEKELCNIDNYFKDDDVFKDIDF